MCSSPANDFEAAAHNRAQLLFIGQDIRQRRSTCRLRMPRSPFSALYTPSLQFSSCRSSTPVIPFNPMDRKRKNAVTLSEPSRCTTLYGEPLQEGLHLASILNSLAGLVSDVLLGDSSRDYGWSPAGLTPQRIRNATRCMQPNLLGTGRTLLICVATAASLRVVRECSP